jgi:serine/threonine protein kinase
MNNYPKDQIGRYRIVRQLGVGGFARVLLGEHIFLKRYAAIKILHHQPDKSEQQSFEAEAQHIVSLEHPHIVRVLDFGIEGVYPYLVMDYAPNGSLHDRYQGNQLPLPLLLDYTRQVASALQYAHNHKIIHRDVKLANLLLGRNQEVILSDFGIAVFAQSFRTPIDVSGTFLYTAPEQLQGRPCFASDQYALGIIVYQWLSGTLPFKGTGHELCSLHLFVPPPPLHDRVPDISPHVEAVVMKALAKYPHERFESVEIFAQALTNAATQPSSSYTSSTVLKSSPSAQIAPTLPVTPDIPQIDSSPSPIIPEKPVAPQTMITSPPAPIPLPLPGLPGEELQEDEGMKKVIEEIIKEEIKQRPPLSPLHPPIARPLVVVMPAQPVAKMVYREHSGWVASIGWSPDGQRIASASWDETVHVWHPVQGDTLYVYRGHTQPVKALAWSPDGRDLATVAWDKTLHVWNTITGNPRFVARDHTAPVEAVAWSPDGLRIASAGHDSIAYVWNATSGERLCAYHGHAGPIWSIAWSPDSLSIATASYDGSVHVWNATTGKKSLVYGQHKSWVSAVAWPSMRPSTIVSASYNGLVSIWDVQTGTTQHLYQGHDQAVKALTCSPAGNTIASAVREVHLWDAVTGQLRFTYTGHSDWINALAWSPDSRSIASASDDQTIHIWQPPPAFGHPW